MQSGVIQAFDQGRPIGRMEVNGEVCTKGMNPVAKGTLPLRGKSYTSSGAGCAGGFDVADFKAPAALRVNGQDVAK